METRKYSFLCRNVLRCLKLKIESHRLNLFRNIHLDRLMRKKHRRLEAGASALPNGAAVQASSTVLYCAWCACMV